MSAKSTISLKEAKHQFSTLISSLSDADKSNFTTFVFEELTSYDDECDFAGPEFNESNTTVEGLLDDPVSLLNTIAADIRTRVPLDAILPSENITSPTTGENADCIPDFTVHVDDFLYNEHEVEELVDDGKLKRNYCKDCGSKNIEPLIFISHSLSRDALYYIFSIRLPLLDNKTVLDIGSRLGTVLYGAYVFTDASRIIGVEMNQSFCEIQNDVVQKYKMGDRIEVLHKRIEDAPEVVEVADVIVINNAFEFYMSPKKQVEVWEFLKRHIRSKTILVACPHLETTFKNIKPNIVLDEWVKPYLSADASSYAGMEADYCDIAFYEIL